MYTFKKFKHLDNNYMLVELNDKVKNNFLSSFLIGIDNKFLKLDTGDLNESTDYYKNKLNDKVMEKFDGKKFNKLNKKHLTYLADLCKMNLVIFDLNKLNLKFSTELNKKNKTVYMFKHGKKEYLLMKQNMRGMVSKLPVGIYEQFGGMPKRNNQSYEQQPYSQKTQSSQQAPPKRSRLLPNNEIEMNSGNDDDDESDYESKTLSRIPDSDIDDDINRIEQINLVRLADTIYELNQIEIENKINFIVSSFYEKKLDNLDEEDNNLEDLEFKFLDENQQYIMKELNIPTRKPDLRQNNDVLVIPESPLHNNKEGGTQQYNQNYNYNSSMAGGKQQGPPYNKYEKSDYVHDFEQVRSNTRLHRLFKKSTYGTILDSIEGQTQTEHIIMNSLGLSNNINQNNNAPIEYRDGKIYSTKITSLEEYERIKHLPIDKKIEEIFDKDTINPKIIFDELIKKCKKIYELIKENKCDYLQFDQGDTKKLLLETPISPNSTIGLTRLRNLPTLIDGAGSSKIDTIIDNKKNKNYTEIYNSIFQMPLTFSLVDYNRVGNSSDGFVMGLNNRNIPIKNGFTVDNLKEVMYNIDNNKNLNQSNEILDLINTTNNDKLQILRKLKFIGDRGQIVSAMKDNENNFTSRTLLGSGDRIFIAYALEQQEPIIFSNQFITRLYVPNILPNFTELKSIEQNLLGKNTSTYYNNKPKEYADTIFEAFLKQNFKKIQQKITLSPIQITISNEEIKELIMSSILSVINVEEQYSRNDNFIRFRDEIINVDKIQYNGSIISNNNYMDYPNNNEESIKVFIKTVIDSNTEKTRKRKRGLYEKLNELYFKYITPGTDRISINEQSNNEYMAFKTLAFQTIITESNNIKSGIFEVLNENIASLFDFKEKAANSIEIIKSYKEEVKNRLKEVVVEYDNVKIDVTRIMNETKLLEYIKKPENQ